MYTDEPDEHGPPAAEGIAQRPGHQLSGTQAHQARGQRERHRSRRGREIMARSRAAPAGTCRSRAARTSTGRRAGELLPPLQRERRLRRPGPRRTRPPACSSRERYRYPKRTRRRIGCARERGRAGHATIDREPRPRRGAGSRRPVGGISRRVPDRRRRNRLSGRQLTRTTAAGGRRRARPRGARRAGASA